MKHSPHKITLTGDINCKLEGSFPGLFLQKDPQNALKSIILMVEIYCRERLQAEVSQGKQYREQSLRKYPTQSFHCPLSIVRTLTLSILILRLLPTRVPHQSIGIQSFFEHPLLTHDYMLTCLSISPSRCDAKPLA